jgi:hypothetical protein
MQGAIVRSSKEMRRCLRMITPRDAVDVIRPVHVNKQLGTWRTKKGLLAKRT